MAKEHETPFLDNPNYVTICLNLIDVTWRHLQGFTFNSKGLLSLYGKCLVMYLDCDGTRRTA